MKWLSTHTLLLVYKDDLVQQKGLLSSARVSKSLTIEKHRELSNVPAADISEPMLFPDLEPRFRYNERYSGKLPPNCCVWGWWRKPWESHGELFAALQEATRGPSKPSALLYNQYLRRLYRAKIQDVYFEPQLTTVVVPSEWRAFCPEYYRDTSHLCGAFLALTIDPQELDAKALGQLFVDAASFEFDAPASATIVPPPEDALPACRSMIDEPPRRRSLRVAETTILVLRPNKQKENTAALLREPDFRDEDLSYALRDTAWPDILDVLGRASVSTWENLDRCSRAIKELGRKARESDSRITRLDLELVARACATRGTRELLTVQNGDGIVRFTPLGQALRQWVTTSGERDARRAAAAVFKAAWSVATQRYNVAPLPEVYFDHLPAMEAIASAVRHELGRKFYRDHLSHNVRAALLSASLAAQVGATLDSGLNEGAVAFFSGLLHDIALPVTTYPDTVGNLAQALSRVQLMETTPPAVASILDRRHLRRSLAYVALLASTPNVSSVLLDDVLAPWQNPEKALLHVDRHLLFEELLCAGSDEHALISAALLFDAAVRGTSKDFDTGVRSLLSRMTGPRSDEKGRELAVILQSMALHDRKPAASYHGVNEPPANTPKPLYWSGFRMPMVVAIADEFQEWGRTVGAIEGLGAVDGTVDLGPGTVRASVVLSDKAETFASVPFSLLESMFGKSRSVGKLIYDNAKTRPFNVEISTDNLRAFKLSYASRGVATKIVLKEGHEFLSKSDIDSQRADEVLGGPDSELLRIVVDAGGNPGRDYVLLDGPKPVLDKCVGLARMHCRFQAITLDSTKISFRFANGSEMRGKIESYRFGEIGRNSAPTDQYPPHGPIAVLRVSLTDVRAADPDPVFRQPHMIPPPHFLDSDWRFTERTASLIVEYCKAQAKTSGEICYLGCPTLALWHAKKCSNSEQWLLLDKGHFALTKWLGALIPPERFRQFDVFTPLDNALRNRFEVVIADPPWYDEEYGAFWQQAQALVKPKGIIGITYYPSTLDEAKYHRFQELMRSEHALFGAKEIDYEVPEFEAISGLQSQFEHPESGIYRPGYMDFYQAPFKKTDSATPRHGKARPRLPHVEMLDGIHYIQFRNSVKDPATYPLRVGVVRHGLDHVTSVAPSCIGWTTRNLVVKISKDIADREISSRAELIRYVAEKDTDSRLTPVNSNS